MLNAVPLRDFLLMLFMTVLLWPLGCWIVYRPGLSWSRVLEAGFFMAMILMILVGIAGVMAAWIRRRIAEFRELIRDCRE